MSASTFSRIAGLMALGAAFAAPGAAITHTVQIVAGGFSPSHLEVAVGDRVVWSNTTSVPHNVVADDGSFRSGDPSPQFWSWGYFVPRGGALSYHSEGAGRPAGTLGVTGIFADGLERATATTWDLVEPPELARCNCYFSGDCAGGDFCNWGVLSQEDNCEWMEVKPLGVPGAGCNVLFPGPVWEGGLCDGLCQPSAAGSIPGGEDKALVSEAVALWAAAILEPSARPGGGPVDPIAADKAMRLPFEHPEAAIQIGRQVADLLMLSGVPGFYMYFCHWEAHPDQPDPALWVDLSPLRCRAALAETLAAALQAEIGLPGSAAAILAERPAACRGAAAAFAGDACPDGQTSCVAQRIAGLAELLTTPPGGDPLRKALALPAPLAGGR